MRPKPAWALLAFCAAVGAAWSALPTAVQSQDATPSNTTQTTRLTSSLELGPVYDQQAQFEFEQQLTPDERARLVSLVSRFELADPECPLPTSDARQPFYVKFNAPLGRVLARQLTDAGAIFIGYAYPNAHFLRARDGLSLGRVASLLRGHPVVAGTMLQRPEDIFDREAWAQFTNPEHEGGEYRVNFWRDTTPADVLAFIDLHGIAIHEASLNPDGQYDLETPYMDLLLSRPALEALAASNLAEWIEITPLLEERNAASTALSIARAQDVGPGTSYNLDGTGMIAGVWDSARARDTHVALQGAASPSPINNGNKRVLKVDGTSLSDHATHVTGTIIGDGTGSSGGGTTGRGYAPKGYVVSYNWNSMASERREARHVYRHVADNHSYGNATTSYGGYDSSAQSSDTDIRDILLNMFKAAGNDGSGSNTCTHDSCMKNSFTIGSVSDSGAISSFSSRGPTNDGRLIPHFTANGAGVTSTYAGSDTAYSSASGTSMASPSACGSMVLLSQLWKREMNNRYLSPDVARGVLAATAIEAYNQGPDYRFGFGIINCKRAADLILANKASSGQHIVRGQIRQGEVREWDLVVSSSATPLKVVCSWLDIFASTGSGTKLINDIDLVLVAPNGTTLHHPWSGLTSGTAGDQTYQWTRTGPNRRDNIELVEVDSPAVGTWKVRVTGHNIPANPQTSFLNDVTGFVLVSERAITAPKIVVEDSLNSGSPVSIPDNSPSGVTRNLVVNGSGTVQQVRLYVDVHHQRRGDVRIRLRHPDGTEVTLNNTGGSTRRDLLAVYPDTRQFADDVAALVGKTVAGTWQVIVSDHTSTNTGSIRYLALEINPSGGGTPNTPPVANAGSNQTVNEGTTVFLNGSGSSDPDGDPLTYSWTRNGGTAPSFTINNPTSVTPNFVAPQVTSNQTAIIRLTVSDGQAQHSADVTITINNVAAPNNPPVANAGTDQTVNEGATVFLNGSGSSDPDGDTLTFSWVRVSGPNFTINNANTSTPNFVAPQVAANEVAVIQLTVSDGQAQDSDTVTINITDVPGANNPPTAHAGSHRYAAFGSTVQLDGTASSDPDGDPLTYSWVQTGGVNLVSISDGTTSTATFVAPIVADVLIFELTVDDGNGLSDTASVIITVNATGLAPAGGSGGGKKSGGGGCAAGIAGTGWLLLLVGAAAIVQRRRRKP